MSESDMTSQRKPSAQARALLRNARPQTDPEPRLEQGDRPQVRPSLAGKYFDDGGAVQPAPSSDFAGGLLAHGDSQRHCESARGLRSNVADLRGRPIRAEGLGVGAGHAGHIPTVGATTERKLKLLSSPQRALDSVTTLLHDDTNHQRRGAAEDKVSQFIGAHGAQIPEHRWEAIRPLVVECVAHMAFDRVHEAKNYLTATVRLVDWAYHVAGQPLEREKIFRPEVIDNLVVSGCDDLAEATRATYRSRLLQMSDRFLESPYRLARGTKFGRFSNASIPLTPDEIARLRLWAEWQPSQYRRVNATVLLALGLGGGLTTSEIISVRAEHVQVDDEGVLVHVTGRRSRSVPLRHEWEQPIATLSQAAMKPQMPLFSPGRKAEASPTLISNFLYSARDLPVRLNVQRLRATWIVTHMANRVPPAIISEAAGLDSPNGLLRFAAFVPDADESTVRLWLRDMRNQDNGDSR